MQRGFKAINAAEGLRTLVSRDSMSRAPVLEAPSIHKANELVKEFEKGANSKLFQKLSKQINSSDKFCNLISIKPYQLSNKVWLRFSFKTGDAMGMNSVTKHSAALVKEILGEDNYKDFKLIALSGNLCTDKKSTHINILEGRGKKVETEIFIPDEVLQRVFKKGTNSKAIEKINWIKNYAGSSLAGTLGGYNANAANAVAALFAATGQDLAEVVESSSCFTHAEAVEGGLRFGVTLPNLEIATIGGGTGFGTANECLKLMQCAGAGKNANDNENVMRLAEIIAAAVTAQELNLLAAYAAGYELAESHVKLARGEKNE